MSVPSAPITAALLAKLAADLPSSYQLFDAMGPTTPSDDVPYVVMFADPGLSDGAPMQVGRELMMQVYMRCVGESAAQSRAGGDRVRASLDGAVLTVAGRQVSVWQEQSTIVSRDDSLAPSVLFEHLILFGVRSSL